MKTSLFGGTGFILSRYAQLYPDNIEIAERNAFVGHGDEILYGISTTSNYHPVVEHADFDIDIDTNLKHFLKVLRSTTGTFNLLSTWFVYGKGAGNHQLHPAREGDPCDPNGFYSITALAREQLLRSYCETFGRNYRIFRLCNVMGNDPRASKHKNALEYIVQGINQNLDINVYTGDNYRNYMHVDDVCRAIRLCLEKGELNTVYNIGAPCSERIYDLIEHAKTLTGSSSRINLVAPPRFHQIVQVPDFWMNTDKLRALGFVPDMNAYQAVDRILANLT